MVRYKVAFDVNGTVNTINVKSVKVGNRYLLCKDDTKTNDSVTVAMLPFDSIEYIVFENMTISGSGVEVEHAVTESTSDVDVTEN